MVFELGTTKCLSFALIIHTRRHATAANSAHRAGAFVVQQPRKQCRADTMLTTIAECRSVKSVLDPRAAAVKEEDDALTPTACSRYHGQWYFNAHAEGALDGVSEPVCKIIAGEPATLTLTCERAFTHSHAHARVCVCSFCFTLVPLIMRRLFARALELVVFLLPYFECTY